MTSDVPSPGLAPTHVVGVVGAGSTGAGIALAASRAGYDVLLHDLSPSRAERTARRLIEQRGAPADRLRVAQEVGDLVGCGLAIEAVSEDLGVKRDVLVSIEKALADDAVVATNTSTRSVSLLSQGLRVPERLVGVHFLHPAEDSAVVEVSPGAATTPEVVERVCALVRSWSRVPIVCEMVPGLIVDRVVSVMHSEAHRMVEEGLTAPATLDHLMRHAAGFARGPLEFGDLSGHDHGMVVTRAIWEQTFHDPRYAPTMLRQRLVDAGWYGVRTGRGIFRYDVPEDHPDGPRAPVQVAPRSLPPAWVEYADGFSVMEPLLERMAAGGVEVRLTDPAPDGVPPVNGLRLPSGGCLVEAHGPRARDVGDDVVALDWALEPALTEVVAITTAANCSAATRTEAIGALQAARLDVVEIEDSPGLVVARCVAVMINEAVDLVSRGQSQADAVDAALSLGMGYPRGPLSWGEQFGPACLVDVLDALHQVHPTGRYRVSPGLRLAADTGSALGR